MSLNALADRDANAQAMGNAVDGNGKPMSMEYHRQQFESRLKNGQYAYARCSRPLFPRLMHQPELSQHTSRPQTICYPLLRRN